MIHKKIKRPLYPLHGVAYRVLYGCALLAISLPLLFVPQMQTQAQTQDIEILKKKIAAVGKLEFKQDVPVRYYNKKQLKKYIGTLFEKEYPVELSEKEGLFIRLMGFVKKKINVRKIRKRILLDNVGGLYNEKTGELLALNEYRNVDFIHSMVLFHELRHAIQDHYFDLTTLLGSYSDFDDRKLAVLSAVEGDATFLMVQCSDLDSDSLTASQDSDVLISFSPIANTTFLYKEPPIIKHQLIMPYITGLRFVGAVFKKKKWKGVNQILLHPPDSTEQILHPEKYLKREKPLEVSVNFKPEGYRLYHSGVIGEYYLNILLKPEARDTPGDHARGWGGDTFHLYKNASSYILVWESLWDKDIHCSDFYSHFKRFIQQRFDVNFKKGNVKGRDFIAGQSGENYFFIARLKNKIFYVRSDNRKQMNSFIYGGNYD